MLSSCLGLSTLVIRGFGPPRLTESQAKEYCHSWATICPDLQVVAFVDLFQFKRVNNTWGKGSCTASPNPFNFSKWVWSLWIEGSLD